MNLKQIKKDLTLIRKKVVEFSKDHKTINSKTLECGCSIASFVIFQHLKHLGLNPVFRSNNIHCFVTCKINEKEYFIDLSLKQFHPKYPKIYFKDSSAPHIPLWVDHVDPHKKKRAADTEAKIKRILRDWPDSQNPFKCENIPKL